MTPQTFIFIGRSGSGKGTQVELLEKYLMSVDPQGSIFHAETGQRFRDFIKKDTYTSALANKINEAGDLQPEFLVVAMWSNAFIDELKAGQHIVLDGCPRKIHEAGVLHSAMQFYGRAKPHVIYINVDRKWATERLLGRKRHDDTEKDINERMSWFETDVIPTVEFYKKNQAYHFLDIDGERSVEDVHKEIVSKLKF